jgi:hypothetical protein
MTRARHLIALLILALGSCQTPPGSLGGGPPPPLALSDAADPAATPRTQFDLVKLRDLRVRVYVGKLAPMSRLHIQFTSPRGEVFCEDQHAYSADPNVTTVHDETLGIDVPVISAQAQWGGYLLERVVPIRGSIFHRFAEPGTWHIEVSVPEVSASFAQDFQFSIAQ